MQRLYAPRQLVPGDVSLSYAQAYDGLTDAEGRRQIGITTLVIPVISNDERLHNIWLN